MHMVIWVKGSPCAKNAYGDSYGSSLEDEEDDVDEVEALVVVVPWPHNKIM